jgi:hydroxyethylthiazole kinase-like uncharacterized protein yjeF
LRVEKGILYLTVEEMAGADRVAIERFGLDVLSLMENAGRGVANLARMMLGGKVAGKKICCLVGKGNNGGDGLVAARHLCNWGAEVVVVLSGEGSELRDAPAKQLATVSRMGIRILGPAGDFGRADLLVDSLLGYGSRGNPREPVAGMIRRANASGIPVLAVDLPSGLDATMGEPGEPCVVAKATITFGLPKVGFLNPKSREFTGELYVADISMPQGAYPGHPENVPDFGSTSLVRLA